MKHQTKTIIGAIAGDVIGSVYEWENHKSRDFPLFTVDEGNPDSLGKGVGSEFIITLLFKTNG